MEWTGFLYRIPRYLLIGLVRFYQLTLSPFLGGACRFTPTCSEYSIQALHKYGAMKGSVLTIYRILRCNPWGGHGYDPPRWFDETAPPATVDDADRTEHEAVLHHSSDQPPAVN